MAKKLTYEELEQRIKELKKRSRQAQGDRGGIEEISIYDRVSP